MKQKLLLAFLFSLLLTTTFSQKVNYWSVNNESRSNIIPAKTAARLSFLTDFKLFNLNVAPLRQELFKVVDNTAKHSTVISLPNADGQIEQFEVFEASNFEPALQARFPEIRAFSGKGLTDKYATLKMSISPQGIQTMVFRTDRENEFIEAYSQDHDVYAVFKSKRKVGQLSWTCFTDNMNLANDVNAQVANYSTARSTGDLKTIRLAQSVTAEYANFFGASTAGTPADQVIVLTAVNNTITRCNGVYEIDLALHLNLVANTTAVFYYNPATDPYATVTNASTPPASWNTSLQTTLTSIIGEANYDIGHLFGASGGGGNAGCIGCVCVNGQKGSGITSPATGTVNPSATFPPAGDGFDIDYVVHEIGHQLGATHTFTFQSEGGTLAASSQMEVGSGITIMGYAGITSQDDSSHSIAYYHAVSIKQIQANLATKTCPVTTAISAVNSTPVVGTLANYTVPKSTPFILTGSATDANPGDALTYQWEQMDPSTSLTGNSSVASQTKASGPNWISFNPTASPSRTFPRLSTILNGLLVTPTLGGDAIANVEALSSVARTLNFRLTVRDNAVYSSTVPVSVGQTNFKDMIVTVSAASGPFAVSSPNTAVSYVGGTTQTITWAVASTTAAPVSCANVKITLSTDGGQTFPIVLAASTPNDGTETVVIPNTATTTARIKIEAVGNIFFDISNTNFTITAPASTTLNLKLFLEGFYSGAGTMNATLYDLGLSSDPTATDNITVNLWSVAHLANPTPDYSLPGLLHINGTATLQFPAGVAGQSFYIAIVHRNSIETWSKLPVSFTSTTSYDFSTALSKAFDDGMNPPMVFKEPGVYALYSGDANQDGTVDGSDAIEVQDNIFQFAFGYDATDVNGDGGTDGSDAIIVQDNGFLFLYYARP